MKRPTYEEITAGGSDSFKRLNPAIGAQVSHCGREQAGADRALVAALPRAIEKQNQRPPLERVQQIENRGVPSGAPRPRVAITLFRVKLLDVETKFGAVQYLLDSLRKARLIPDDRECDIELVVDQQRVPAYAQEGTGVVITYPKK